MHTMHKFISGGVIVVDYVGHVGAVVPDTTLCYVQMQTAVNYEQMQSSCIALRRLR